MAPSRIVCTTFISEFRAARALVLSDAEGFTQILHVIERLGAYLHRRSGDLGKYESCLTEIAMASPLATEAPALWRQFHTPFEQQYKLVRDGRNDAMHQGAYARHLAANLVQLSLTLEDALLSTVHGEPLIADLMIRTPTIAELWFPVSFARQLLLSNGFSHLPIQDKNGRWHLLSDYAVARYLSAPSLERKRRLATPIEEALQGTDSPLRLKIANMCPATTTLAKAIAQLGASGEPLLVFDDFRGQQSLIGIVSPFDCL